MRLGLQTSFLVCVEFCIGLHWFYLFADSMQCILSLLQRVGAEYNGTIQISLCTVY